MAKKILAILAHEDDEVIGCGGLLALNHLQQGENYVVCAAGFDEKRKAELEAACEILGVNDIDMLEIENILDHSKQEIIDILKSKIRAYQPHIIVTHGTEFDYNREHRIIGELALDAAQAALHGKAPGSSWRVDEILLTETHNLFPKPDRVYDISDVFETKQEAMKAHVSQLEKQTTAQNYYLRLNEYKALLRGLQSGCRYGEAFMARTLPVFADLYSEPLARKEV